MTTSTVAMVYESKEGFERLDKKVLKSKNAKIRGCATYFSRLEGFADQPKEGVWGLWRGEK